MSTITVSDTEDMWIFGYGSLIWKTNFPYVDSVVGNIRGYARRFWQGSTDHRGVPGKPGRVVTLVKDKTEIVSGVAFKVDNKDRDDVIRYLDFREKGGYQLTEMEFYPVTSHKPFQVFVYMATEQNPNYLGPASHKDIAQQIVTSTGPSGPNLEYFSNLVTSLEKICPTLVDNHLQSIKVQLEKLVMVR